MSIHRDAHAVLRDWRDVEADLRSVAPDGPEALLLRHEVERLRDEHHRLGDEAVKSQQPSLAPVPADRRGRRLLAAP